MAVTIYQVLNLSDSILESFKDKPFLLSDYFLSSDSYINSIYRAGMLEFVDEALYNIIAKIVVSGRWKNVIEAHVLEGGSWTKIEPNNIVIDGNWKKIKTLGTYDARR